MIFQRFSGNKTKRQNPCTVVTAPPYLLDVLLRQRGPTCSGHRLPRPFPLLPDVPVPATHVDRTPYARPSVGKMLASKRGADDTTQFSNKNKRSCSYELPGNNQGIWSQLSEEVASNLSRSVVLLILTNGRIMLSQSCGIAIECQSNVTKFVTSGNLVEDLRYYGMENKIEVYTVKEMLS